MLRKRKKIRDEDMKSKLHLGSHKVIANVMSPMCVGTVPES